MTRTQEDPVTSSAGQQAAAVPETAVGVDPAQAQSRARELLDGLGEEELELHERSDFQPSLAHPVWFFVQRVIAAVSMVMLSLTLLPVVYLAVKLTSPGPVFFKQRRRGAGGRKFTIYKIRSLRVGTEKSTALGVGRGESAVTPIGGILRASKIDELPQLLNVVRGEMELVGPRPLPVALEDDLRQRFSRFRTRNKVRPGLTSFAQVVVLENGVGDQLDEDWIQRFQAELHYITNKSFSYDVFVLGMTMLYWARKVAGALRKRLLRRDGNSVDRDGAVTRVLRAPIANLDYAGVVDRTASWVDSGERHYVAICPVHSVIESLLDARHRAILDGAGLNTADGMPVVWAQRCLGYPKATRVYGPTLMLHLLARAAQSGWRVAFYGGHPDRLPVLLDTLSVAFPKLEICYSESPPFRALSAEEDESLCEKLREADPQLVFVGLGCPKQERWMADHVGRVPGVMFGVGAAFDFHAGAVRQAPPILQRCGMEWAFRLAMEPRRLFKRYATTNPIFVVRFGLQLARRLLGRAKFQERGAVDQPADAASRSERVAICVGTWRRPEMLGRLLDSIEQMQRPAGVSQIEVRVVDNDSERSAEAVVRSFAERVSDRLEVSYQHESERNIARTRNRALDHGPADWFAFVDDDEVVDANWLARLLATCRGAPCDAAFGAVLAERSDGEPLPKWLRNSGLLDKLPYPAGEAVGSNHARTSNALVSAAALERFGGLRFDPSFGRSGGEDSDLFGRLHAHGAVYHAVPDAVVREQIAPEQASFRWLAKRYLRNGHNFERLRAGREPLGTPLVRAAVRMTKVSFQMLIGLPAAAFGNHTPVVRASLETVRAWGGLVEWLRPTKVDALDGYASHVQTPCADEVAKEQG